MEYLYSLIRGVNDGIILLIGIAMVYFINKKRNRWNK
jgi:hypothetical protein